MAKQWSEFTREEKREERFQRWLSPAGVNFISPEAGKKYLAPRAINEYCRKLITVCGENGGYILTFGSSIARCNPANRPAIIEAAKEYGVY